MTNDSRPSSTNPVKKAYHTPRLTVFGGLRELTLQNLTTPMPADNKGVGEGGKVISVV